MNVAAVIVTYNPEMERFRKVLASLYKQSVAVFVVDNGSKNVGEIERLLKDKPNLIKRGRNYGIVSINVGIARCLRHNPKWILTMDQDSIVAPNGISKILSNYEALPKSVRDEVGILVLSGAAHYNDIYARPLEGNRHFIAAKFVITSGNLVKADVFGHIRFREDLFIDQVDHEFDIRVRRKGLSILVSSGKLLDHSLGRSVVVNGKPIVYHNERRLYYFTRNSTYLATRYPEFSPRFYITGILTIYSRFLKVNGFAGLPRAAYVFFRALADGLTGNLGENKKISELKTLVV